MTVSRTVADQLARAAGIRRMFETGRRLRSERGSQNVFDFSLGNPDADAPEAVQLALEEVARERTPRGHAYMTNAGFLETREFVARDLAAHTGLPFESKHIVMTVGAAGALTVALRTMIEPGDEVILVAPYFAEYVHYVANFGGVPVLCDADDALQPDVENIGRAIGPRTKALILNSPNNPSGAVYSSERLEQIGQLLAREAPRVVVLSDEPYREMTFDGTPAPSPAAHIEQTLTAYSWSKSLALAGERCGYLAVSPRMRDAKLRIDACCYAMRSLGFVNAPAIWQRVIARAGKQEIDMAPYVRRAELLGHGLERAGYELVAPKGGFFLFPRTPVPDDVAFVDSLVQHGILAVPGTVFGRRGHMRLSLTADEGVIERALPGFANALASV